jgi:hypothetical protein
MAQRIYKDKEDRDKKLGLVIDDRHELLAIYSSQCAICKHFERWDYFCLSYPNGIPDKLLSGEWKHDEIRADQAGTNTFINIRPNVSLI